MTTQSTAQPAYGQPCTVIPITALIGHMPLPGEDPELLVKCALEYEADRTDREPLAFILPKERDASGVYRSTGLVQLYRFSPTDEKSYLEEMNERESAYPPLGADELVPDLDLGSEEPGGDAQPHRSLPSTHRSYRIE